jgi:hypothetical protein
MEGNQATLNYGRLAQPLGVLRPGRRFWWSEEPRRSPAEYAAELARDRFWRDEQRRLIGTHPDFPEVLMLLDLSEELAHGLVLILSRLPEERRKPFAEVFFDVSRL